MRLHFLGANRQVTGSRYCLEVDGSKILIDCGLFQERPFALRNWQPCPIPPEEIEALLLTHAHLDHCGLIPKLVREGFRGPIHATAATIDLAEIILRDSAKIQMEDAAYKKRRHRKQHHKSQRPEVPLYDNDDAERALPLFREVAYRKPLKINDHFTAVYHDAGHILGSAMIEITARENGQSRSVLFSGDIGQWGKPLIGDPSLLDEADYVVMESTYGDRDHGNHGGPASIEKQLEETIRKTVSQGGNLVIPTFAVERAQELMYYIGRLVHDDRIPDVPVFLDSPMAVDATEVFRKHRNLFDAAAWTAIFKHEPPLRFPGLSLVRSVEDSRRINASNMPSIIMSTSGMCTAGRIKHHLRHNISRPESHIMFVGYQGRGTLGRQILEGEREVRIHGRKCAVHASVSQISGFSAHADRSALSRWLSHIKPPKQVFLTHGDEDAAESFAEHVREELGLEVTVPEFEQVVELA